MELGKMFAEGREIYFFGEDNYSNGMNKCVCSPEDKEFFLERGSFFDNPAKNDNSQESFLLYGSVENYEEFIKDWANACASNLTMRELGISINDVLDKTPKWINNRSLKFKREKEIELELIAQYL